MLQLSFVPDKVELGARTTTQLCLVNAGSTEISAVQLSFRMPSSIQLLRGQTRWAVQRLHPGEMVQTSLIVKALQAGSFALEMVHVSYRDVQGRPQHDIGPTPRWQVGPAAPLPAPYPAWPALLELQLAVTPLTHDVWSLWQGTLWNHGPGIARRLSIATDDACWQTRPVELDCLAAGQRAVVQLNLKPLAVGEVLLSLAMRYQLEDGSPSTVSWSSLVTVAAALPATRLNIEQLVQVQGDIGLLKQTTRNSQAKFLATEGSVCPRCGAHVSPGSTARFCIDCGARLT